MSTSHALTLSGCSPVPLAHYLKALGILRLVSEQKDASATGHWQRDQFVLTSSLDRDALLKFFLEEYEPTPVLSPWNAGSGFYLQEEKLNERDSSGKKIKTGNRNQETSATRVVSKILASNNPRLTGYKSLIKQTKILLECKGLNSAPDTSGSAKDDLIIELRSKWPDTAIEWLDCVTVLTKSRDAKSKTGLKPNYTTLLGSGANDGNADFTSNFMQRLTDIFNSDKNQSMGWLTACIFNENSSKSRVEALAGQYAPGTAGGANSTSGFASKFSINPWDFVLLIEGCLFFAAAAVRHHSSNDSTVSYPFCVNSNGVGYASSSSMDEKADKSLTEEMWLPIWTRSCTTKELRFIFSEGRAQLRGREARSGIDFAQAIGTLGTDAGITSFQRIGFFVRNGKSVFATPLTRISAKRNIAVDLLSDIDIWLSRFRQEATKDTATNSVKRSLLSLESRIMDLCVGESPDRLVNIFIALGQCQALLSRCVTKRNENPPPPLSGLRKAWLKDNWSNGRYGTEFRLAASLASVNGKFGKDTMFMRCHLENVDVANSRKKLKFRWSEAASNNVQWSKSPLPTVMNNIFSRRLLLNEEASRKSSEQWASFTDIKAFIEGHTDDRLLSNLLWSMSLIDWYDTEKLPDHDHGRVVPPTFYALLKCCFPPSLDKPPEDFLKVPVVPAIHKHAAQGNGTQAATHAIRRLRGSGYQPILNEISVQGDQACRSAAALLFPISITAQEALIKQITRPDKD